MTDAETTVDSIVRGQLKLEQPRRGYRFSIDAVLLADHARKHFSEPERFVDLGAGCGVVGLLLAGWWPNAQFVLVELQSELATIARRNIHRNGFEARGTVVEGDLRSGGWTRTGKRTIVVSNPPYYPEGSGRLSPDPMLAIAKHERSCPLPGLLDAATSLDPGDVLLLIHQGDRRDELIEGMRRAGFGNLVLRAISLRPGRKNSRILISGIRGGRSGASALELAPLVVNDAAGDYSAEVLEILGEQLGGQL